MKTVIAGSREYDNYEAVKSILDRCPWKITEVVSGTARGPDQLGERWAEENNISCVKFQPDWDTHGQSAGHIRNAEMAQYGEAVIVFWDGASKGTKNMIDVSLKNRLHVLVVQV